MANGAGDPVAYPTYMAYIRHFFEDRDIDHMKDRGINLATYEGVKSNALRIYFRTMPWREVTLRGRCTACR